MTWLKRTCRPSMISSKALEAKLVCRIVRVLATKAASWSKGKSSVRAALGVVWLGVAPLVWVEAGRSRIDGW